MSVELFESLYFTYPLIAVSSGVAKASISLIFKFFMENVKFKYILESSIIVEGTSEKSKSATTPTAVDIVTGILYTIGVFS